MSLHFSAVLRPSWVYIEGLSCRLYTGSIMDQWSRFPQPNKATLSAWREGGGGRFSRPVDHRVS